MYLKIYIENTKIYFNRRLFTLICGIGKISNFIMFKNNAIDFGIVFL